MTRTQDKGYSLLGLQAFRLLSLNHFGSFNIIGISAMTTKQPLFRPYLSGEELTAILSLVLAAKQSGDSSPTLESVRKKLSQFKYKISQALLEPAYTSKGRQTLASKLGEDSQNNGDTGESKSEAYLKRLSLLSPTIMSPEERYNYLAMQAMSDVSTLTEEERKEGERLEIEVTGFSSGIFG